MRRDYFTLDARGLDWVDTDDDPEKPTVTIEFEGPSSLLEERLRGRSSTLLQSEEIDVSFRFLTPVDEPDAIGVVSVTDRVTGDFVLELNQDADDVLRFVRAARAYGNRSNAADGRYRIEIRIAGDEVVAYDKGSFLVYDSEGTLLRRHSLIPGGVEL